MTPNTENNTSNNKDRVYESILEEDLQQENVEPIGVNQHDTPEDSFANANANTGGSGLGGGIGSTLPETTTPINTLSTDNSGLGGISGGGSLSSQDGGGGLSQLGGGGGNLSQTPVTPLVNEETTTNETGTESGTSTENTTIENLEQSAENTVQPDVMDTASNQLLSLINEGRNAEGIPESTGSGSGSLSDLKGGGGSLGAGGGGNLSGGGGGSLGSGGGAPLESGSGTTSENNTESGQETTEQAPPVTADSAIMSSFGGGQPEATALTEEQKAQQEAEQAAAAETQRQTEAGRTAGLQVGRVNGLRKFIYFENNEMKIVPFPATDTDGTQYASLDAYNQAMQTALDTNTNNAFRVAYNQSYNEGYTEGQRLERSVAERQKQQEAQNPKYLEGYSMGTEAGTKAASDDAADKARAKELNAAIQALVRPTDGSADPNELKRKGFNIGYNQAYNEALSAKYAARKANPADALLSNPEFRTGYDAGHRMGMAKGKGETVTAEMQQIDSNMNALDSKVSMTAKGYLMGYNKGYSDAQQARAVEHAQQRQAMLSDPYYSAGMVKGTIEILLKSQNYDGYEQLTMDVLEGRKNLDSLLSSPFPVPESAINFYQTEKLHTKTQSAEQQNLFRNGYFNGYNTAASQTTVREQKQQEAADQGDERYQQGDRIGKTAGEAASIRDEYRRKLSSMVSQRLALNADNNTPSAEETALLEKINTIQLNLQLIQDAVDAEPSGSLYRKGYYRSYNTAYNAENANRLAARSSHRENQMGSATGDGQSSGEFQKGLLTGRTIGTMVRNFRQNGNAPDDLQTKIDDATDAARGKGAAFYNGFIYGYNETATAATSLSAAGTDNAFSNAINAKRAEVLKNAGSDKPVFEFFFNKASQAGYDAFFNFYKKTESQRGENPQKAWGKRKEEPDKKSIKSEIKSEVEDTDNKLSFEVNNTEKLNKLTDLYISAFEEGKTIGTQLGQNFAEGYEDAMEGRPSSLTSREPKKVPKYAEGYQLGLSESQYRNFELSAMNALGLANSDERRRQAVQQNSSDDYQNGYNKHYNHWLKIYLITSGLSVPAELQGLDINIIPKPKKEDSEEEEIPEGIISELQTATSIKRSQNTIVDQIIAAEKDKMKMNADRTAIATEMALDENEINDAILESFVKNKIAQFKTGYLKAIEDAQAQTANGQNEDVAYQKGFRIGFVQSGASLPPMNATLHSTFDNLTEMPADTSNAHYMRGKARGMQVGTMVKNGTLAGNEALAEMQGAAYLEGYRKGREEATDAAEEYVEAMHGTGTVEEPSVEENEERNKLSGETQQGFDDAYNLTFDKKKAYFAGYYVGMQLATNESTADDYARDSTLEREALSNIDTQFNNEFQQGLVEGRESGLIMGTGGNAGILRNLQLQRKIAELQRTKGEAIAEAYKKGNEAGYAKGLETSRNSLPQVHAEITEKGISGTFESMIASLDKVGKAFVKLKVEESGANPQDIARKYASITDLQSSLQSKIKKDKSSAENLASIKTGLSIARAAITTDTEDEKTQLDAKFEEWIKLTDEYLAQFEKAFKEGLEEGVRQKETNDQNARGGDGQDFLQQSLNSISNRAEASYTSGFSDGGKLIRDMNRKGATPSQSDMQNSKFKLISSMRKRFKEALGDEYRDLRNHVPPHDNKALFETYNAKRLGYLEILQKFVDAPNLNYDPQNNMEQFIEGEIKVLYKELEDLIKGLQNPQAKSFFENQYKNTWKKRFPLYQQGFNSGFELALQNALHHQSGIENTGSGSSDLMQEIYEMIKAGEIQDGDIGDIDWLPRQDELLHQIYTTRLEIDTEELAIYNTNEVMLDLKDELNAQKFLLDKHREISGNSSGGDDLDSFEVEGLELFNKVEALDTEVKEKENIIKTANESIEQKAAALLKFIRENTGFSPPDNTLSSLKTYLMAEQGQLEMQGTYSDKEGNATISGSGTFSLQDRSERWKYTGSGILFELGDLRLSSATVEVFAKEYYVKLSGGGIAKVPVYEGNVMKQELIAFGNLDLEMGLGIVEQMDAQLNLGDKLEAGGLLGSSWFSSLFG